jgi:hypothetical protein
LHIQDRTGGTLRSWGDSEAHAGRLDVSNGCDLPGRKIEKLKREVTVRCVWNVIDPLVCDGVREIEHRRKDLDFFAPLHRNSPQGTPRLKIRIIWPQEVEKLAVC